MLTNGNFAHAQHLQSLGHMAGGMVHDFNNLLCVIEGYARILERQFEQDSAAQEKVKRILVATKRGAGLTRRLLSFGHHDLANDTSCDLVRAVRETEILLKPLIDDRIKLELFLPKNPIHVACDVDSIVQILINLAINARDAIHESGHLRIQVTVENNETAILSVMDNGSGIPKEILQHIFQPFFTTKPQGKGTGLGLSIIAGLMEQVKGSIHVESVPGNGTRFDLRFPRVKPPKTKPKPASKIVNISPAMECALQLVQAMQD